jgi:ferritin-like metal-binding protein YciE
MPANVEKELVKHLIEAHAMERQALQLLEKGSQIAGDEEVARIYRAHRLQTEEHRRYVEERLEAHGESPSMIKDVAMQVGAIGIGALAQASPETPVLLPRVAFAFENLEIATYEVIKRLAKRAGDHETVAVAERILEQERAAAELVAGTFERALELSLGESPRAPLPGVTPIAPPSERDANGHQGPQEFKHVPPDEPINQPARVETPTSQRDREGEEFPEPGYPVDDTQPYGGGVPKPTHPEPVEHPPGR